MVLGGSGALGRSGLGVEGIGGRDIVSSFGSPLLAGVRASIRAFLSGRVAGLDEGESSSVAMSVVHNSSSDGAFSRNPGIKVDFTQVK